MKLKKQIEVTDDIIAQIERVTSTTIEPNSIVVFEANAASTRPLSQNTFYDGAIMARSMLEEMAVALNTGEESVPLHTLHLAGDEIPKGRVFHGAVIDNVDGSSDLKTMFYLPLMEKELIDKINLSILDEVSVGLKPKQALCSKCGFDYLGADSGFEYLWSKTCDDNHVLGEDGAHLKLIGLDKWMELSLVSRGASDKPKILSRVRRLVSKEENDRMAADGKPLEALFLYNSMAMENNDMPKKLTAEEKAAAKAVTDAATLAASTAAAKAKAKVEALAAEAAEGEFDAEASFEALTAQIATLTGLLTNTEDEPTVDELKAQLSEAKSEIETLKAADADAVAAAEAAAAEAAALAEALPNGGVAASAINDAEIKGKIPLKASAFKTRKNR